MTSARRLAVAVAAAGAGRAARHVLGRAYPPGAPRWTRTNHRGEPISLLEGPAVAAGLLTGALAAGGRVGAAGAVAITGAAAFGLVDDLTEQPSGARKGLRGHLGALAHGELTTGGLKVLGIGVTGLVAAVVAGGGAGRATGAGGDRRGTAGHVADVMTSGALIAATANLVNLLDLRPGRALKAGAIAAAPLLPGVGGGLAAACLGAAAAGIGPDLAERDMLGDGGANALGAAIGTAVVVGAPRPVRLALLAGVVGLTLASEKVSFTAVIERTPALRAIDRWGRRPVEPVQLP
jgi:UDP-N-acetylmuramyl pentapeptide phosphotransferase/UDP-N-acetylglucosamine-1-phosphate transferase